MKDPTQRVHVKAGLAVSIVQKQHQVTDTLTHGYVKRVLTKSSTHPHGIKVQLKSGFVGRVKRID